MTQVIRVAQHHPFDFQNAIYIDCNMQLKNATCGERSTCPINAVVEVIGDQWTLLVLRDMLLLSKARFSEFRQSDEGVATNILTARLSRLQALGLIERHPDPQDGRGALYLPSDRALDLIPVLLAAMAWSDVHQPGTQAYSDVLAGYRANPHAITERIKSKGRQEGEALLS